MRSETNFKTWLVTNGRSDRTAKSYYGAIANKLSNLAIEHRITDQPLLEYAGSKPLERIVHEIRELDEFASSNTKGKGMYGAALRQLIAFRALPDSEALQRDLKSIYSDKDADETMRQALTQARVGQGRYRQSLIALWGRCAVTGYPFLPLLVASHLKPWNAASNDERLDPHNGFLLVPTLDKAFDRGYLTFKDDGRPMISPELQNPDQLNISASLRATVLPENQNYLAYHREMQFRR